MTAILAWSHTPLGITVTVVALGWASTVVLCWAGRWAR